MVIHSFQSIQKKTPLKYISRETRLSHNGHELTGYNRELKCSDSTVTKRKHKKNNKNCPIIHKEEHNDTIKVFSVCILIILIVLFFYILENISQNT